MKIVSDKIAEIKDELNGAKKYAERYIQYKVSKPDWSRMFGEMASAELTHAEYLKNMGEQCIKDLPYIPEEDREAWEKCLRRYAEKRACVNMMLSK